ncbi:MAG: phosphatidylserine/phosphatidylglycerophosphate/cardiolipin synthase family protein [Kofleriaceae bacterium]|nr:phosphatidylserine/phosphatidylglycerophosphate/cardiolipin synthase family protein [Kofleriaceae bacterium]
MKSQTGALEDFLGKRRDQWRAALEVTPLRSGAQAYPAMLAAIAGATRSIVFEMYIFADDRIGRRFASALGERAAAGVSVRLIYDAVGSFRFALRESLEAAGVQVVEFHPIAPWRKRFNLSHRDHRKIMVVDDEVGFVGGINIGEDYADLNDGGKGWHDLHCRVRGEVVTDLARSFRRTWIHNGGALYDAPVLLSSVGRPMITPPAIRVVENGPLKSLAIRSAYLRAIANARDHVQLQNAYFLPDRSVRAALIRARKRGVAVTVIVPGRSDMRSVQWASLYVFRRLIPHGVRVLRWRGPMMHAKSAVVDASWSTIGSYNLDARSLRYNLEVAVEIVSATTGAQMSEAFTRDTVNCDEFSHTEWSNLPWYHKALAWLMYRFRRWM